MAEKQHGIWVGSLACNVTEDVLYNLFSKFGEVKSVFIVRDKRGDSKRSGYVNFSSPEFAQCAASVMNGFMLNGQAIETKAPEELKETAGESVENKKDQRMYTDCLFYMDKRECTRNMFKCPFRHCEKARLSNNVCAKWLERKCEDIECENRHPRLTKNGELDNNNSANRCPSHNAFKCYGECGNSKCETHFMDRRAYVEHVRLMKEKVANPVSHCIKCQAVFFNSSEKLGHVCHVSLTDTQQLDKLQHFAPTWLPAEKDIAKPVPLHARQTPSETVLQQTPIEIRGVSPKTSQTHVFSGSPCDLVDAVCGKSQCLNTSKKNTEPVGVFWDFENCPIPKGKSALAVVQKLRTVFFQNKREVEFMCVCDISKEKKAVIEELNKAQVTVVHINSTSKNAADDKLRQSLRRFAHTYCRPATVILISGDGNFTVELSDLRHRHNFRIICLHNEAASNALQAFAHECHRFDLIIEDLDAFLPPQTNFKGAVDVLITNIPSLKSRVQLKSRLTKLSDNCGGKVLTIHSSMAIIRFPNSEAAFRARRRLDKEELFGSTLQASLLPSSFTQPTNKNIIHDHERRTLNNRNSHPISPMKAAYVSPMVNTTPLTNNQSKPTHLRTPIQLKTPAQLGNTTQQEKPSPRRSIMDVPFGRLQNHGDPKKQPIINTAASNAPVMNNGTIFTNHTLLGNQQPSPKHVTNIRNVNQTYQKTLTTTTTNNIIRNNGGITNHSSPSTQSPHNVRNLNKQSQKQAGVPTIDVPLRHNATDCDHPLSGRQHSISNSQNMQKEVQMYPSTTTTKNVPFQIHHGQICNHSLSGNRHSSPDHVINFQNLNKQIQVYHNNNNMLIPYSPNVLHFPPQVHPQFHSALFSPMVNHSLQRRSPSPDQPHGGVDLLVTNLNESLPKDDVKKKLACVFREHCKVYNVLLYARPGAALRAYIKVPKMFDAQVAISKLSGSAMQGKVIHVSLASDSDKQLCYFQDEVTELLREAPLNWLPLTTFMENYERKYRKHFDLSTLNQVKDCVVVDGSPGCQTLSLRGNKAGSELVKHDPLSFSSDVYKLLNHYGGVIALASFPALYWIEYHKEMQLSASGRTLVEILNDIPNIMVKSTTEMSVVNKTVTWIKPMTKPCDVSYFVKFTSRLLEVFRQDHEFEVTIEDFKKKYLLLFEEELNHLNYGFSCVEDLFEAFPNIIKVRRDKKLISLTQEQRLTVFTREITELLSQFDDNTTLFSTFSALYAKYFGHEFKASSFGFNRFNELIKAIPETAQVSGHGQLKAVKLIKECDTTVLSVCSLDELENRLSVMIKGRQNREIPLVGLNKLYYSNFGHHLKVQQYKCDNLTQLLQRLNGLQIVKKNGGEFLQLCTKNIVKVVQKDLAALLDKEEGKFLFVKNIIPSYEAMFKKSFVDPGLVTLPEILQPNKYFQVLGNGNEQIIKTPDEESDVNVLMCTTAVEILCDCPEYTSPKPSFLSLYHNKLLKRYERFIKNLNQDTSCLPSCIATVRHNDEEWVSLKLEYRQRILIERLKELFSESTEPVLLSQLFQKYSKCYNASLELSHFGLTNMGDLKPLLLGVIEMTFSNSGEYTEASLSLSRLSRLDKEFQVILKNSAGCIFLCRLSSAYQQMFGKALVVADFGYSKLGSLLKAVCQTCKIIGDGSEKLVISVSNGIYGRICKGRNDLLNVRVLQEEKKKKDDNNKALCPVDLLSKNTTENSTSQNTVRSHDTKPSCHSNAVTVSTSRRTTPADHTTNTVNEMVISTTRSRPTSQKVRLAANFQTPLHTKK